MLVTSITASLASIISIMAMNITLSIYGNSMGILGGSYFRLDRELFVLTDRFE